jgi:hypothetical protein
MNPLGYSQTGEKAKLVAALPMNLGCFGEMSREEDEAGEGVECLPSPPSRDNLYGR